MTCLVMYVKFASAILTAVVAYVVLYE